MPLKAIKAVLDEDPERAHALVELEDRILERARSDEGARVSRAEAARRYGVPREALTRLEELGVLSPNSRGYAALDQQILEAISRFRAGGYDEEIGFTVYDTLRYKQARGAAGQGGGRADLRAPGGRGSRPSGGAARGGRGAAARPHRGASLEAAGGGDDPPARGPLRLSHSTTPATSTGRNRPVRLWRLSAVDRRSVVVTW